MINIEAIKRVLESQGKLYFKPFHFNGAKQDYWAYRTNENDFHVCDDNLIDISHSKIGIKNPWYFVLNTEKDYRLLEEGESVSVIQDKQPDNLIKNVWLIKENIIDNTENDIDGYKYVTDEWIIFETETIEIKFNESNYWIPDKKVACYDSRNFLEKSDVFYCGTYNDSVLFFSERGYHLEYKHIGITRLHDFDKLVVWFCKDGIRLVDINPKNGFFLFELYEHSIRMESFGWYYIEDKCIGSYIINNKFDIDELNIFASDNIFVLSDDSSWITIDRLGNIGTEKRGKIVSFCNDIIKTDSSPCGQQEKEFEFYDYKGNCLSRITNKCDNYATVTKSIETATFADESNKDTILTLKGVINTYNQSLVIPIIYKKLELFDYGRNFYAIIGEEFTDKSGAKTFQYGLFVNDYLLLPCNNIEIKSLSNNLFVWRKGNKYGLVSNGRICCDPIYDKVAIAFDNYTSDKYACIYAKDKCGIFVPDWDLFIPPKYKNIMAFVEEQFVLADGILYSTTDGNLTLVKDVTKYDYIGGLCWYHLFLEKESSKYRINSYICVLLKDGKLFEEDVINAKYDHNIDDDCKSDIDWWQYSPILSLGHRSVFYSVKENCFKDDIYFFSSSSEPYIDLDEGYNYERDTYYALGGDDYDQWKENGGDLDEMMEGMGF